METVSRAKLQKMKSQQILSREASYCFKEQNYKNESQSQLNTFYVFFTVSKSKITKMKANHNIVNTDVFITVQEQIKKKLITTSPFPLLFHCFKEQNYKNENQSQRITEYLVINCFKEQNYKVKANHNSLSPYTFLTVSKSKITKNESQSQSDVVDFT